MRLRRLYHYELLSTQYRHHDKYYLVFAGTPSIGETSQYHDNILMLHFNFNPELQFQYLFIYL